MNIEQLEGKWEQLKGQITEKWGKLTDNDMTAISGKKDQLIGKLRQYYGYGKQEAEQQLSAFFRESKRVVAPKKIELEPKSRVKVDM